MASEALHRPEPVSAAEEGIDADLDWTVWESLTADLLPEAAADHGEDDLLSPPPTFW